MNKITKLTPRLLRQMIIVEKKKLQTEVLEQEKEEAENIEAQEVEAGDYAGALEKDIDHLKVLKIKEK